MKYNVLLLGLSVCLITLGAGCTVEATCYGIESDKTILKFEYSSPQPSIIVMDEDGKNPERVYGQLNEQEFRYADGTGFKFDSETATGFGGLIDGISAQKIQCPN